MPYKSVWVAPEIFLEHKGVTVYHVYHDDEFDQGPYELTFTTDEGSRLDDNEVFDVASLNVPLAHRLKEHPPFLNSPEFQHATGEDQIRICAEWAAWHEVKPQAIKDIICQAIDMGLIKNPGEES